MEDEELEMPALKGESVPKNNASEDEKPLLEDNEEDEIAFSDDESSDSDSDEEETDIRYHDDDSYKMISIMRILKSLIQFKKIMMMK